MRASWRPRCCLSCGEPLEEWKHPLELDAYVPCLPCGRLFRVLAGDALEPVLLSLEPPELRQVFDDLLAAWFELQRRRASIPASLLGGHEHRAAA